ncbi:hypothetical protein AAGS40_00850 [Paraburkholderia sp. PREW-6R]|uniref:hypothetical protein n=1 Tax=Paraburkholderia sp. PREW-6R TaxID=3141544 RepID=UPI0031F56B98
MTSKFKLSLPASTTEPRPISTEDFANAAGMVRSQREPRPPKPVRLNLDLAPDLHARVKLRAANLRFTGAQYVRELILKDLADQILE